MDYFSLLPWEIIELAYEFMSIPTKSCFSQTCKTYYQCLSVETNSIYAGWLKFKKMMDRNEKMMDGIKINRISDVTTNTEFSETPIMDINKLAEFYQLEFKNFRLHNYQHEVCYDIHHNQKPLLAAHLCFNSVNGYYGNLNHPKHPCNVERKIFSLLNTMIADGKKIFILQPIGYFKTKSSQFIDYTYNDVENLSDLNHLINGLREKEFEKFASVTIYEYCNGGSLREYLKFRSYILTLHEWTVILFQVIYTLAIIQEKYPTFRHNDLRTMTISVHLDDNLTGEETYPIGKYIFRLQNTNFQTRLQPSSFASIDGLVDNNKVNSDWVKNIKISQKANKYYDLHYFHQALCCAIIFDLEGMYTRDEVYNFLNNVLPKEITDFLGRVLPSEFRRNNNNTNVNRRGRLQVDVEYTTPYDVLATDPLFEKYRKMI